MQLKRRQRLRLKRALLASSCALLGTSGAAMADKGDWSFDTGLLYYSEADRVQAIEPAVIMKRDFGDDAYLSSRVVTDSLTGATPTGAMASSKGGTTTSASGVSNNTAPGKTPLDDRFNDLRRAISATWSQPFAGLWHLDAGVSYSIEYDFKSEGVNALVARDFNERNTTLSGGVAEEWDEVFPIGGIHAPLTSVPTTTNGISNDPIAANRTKKVQDLLVGVTQVMTHDWIAELNFSYSHADGYENDPYKVVSIINTHLGGAGALPGFPGGPGGGGFGPPVGEPIDQIYENRPDLHQKRALFLDNKVYLGGDVLDFSYRYGWDDWGINSHTYELRYRMPFGGRFYVMPHLRYYKQSAADFYHRGLLDTDALPQYVSADYRLAEFSARTLGVELGMQTSWGGRASIRVERYVQSGGGDNSHVQIGVQQPYDLFPELKADIVQLSLSF